MQAKVDEDKDALQTAQANSDVAAAGADANPEDEVRLPGTLVGPIPGPPERRGFIKACVGGMTVVAAGTVAYPVLTFLKLPRKLGESHVLKIPLSSLHEDQAVYKEMAGTTYVVLFTGKVPKIFNAACTHLGCLVTWEAAKHEFHCPCHGAVFDDQGAPVSGPVSVPLETIPVKIEKDQIVIT